MNLLPKNKKELLQVLAKQKDFKVEVLFTGPLTDLNSYVRSLKPGSYTVIVIKD
jgi:hypothetical protein